MASSMLLDDQIKIKISHHNFSWKYIHILLPWNRKLSLALLPVLWFLDSYWLTYIRDKGLSLLANQLDSSVGGSGYCTENGDSLFDTSDHAFLHYQYFFFFSFEITLNFYCVIHCRSHAIFHATLAIYFVLHGSGVTIILFIIKSKNLKNLNIL